MKNWDEREKSQDMKIVDLSENMTEKERNIEKFLSWQMKTHVSGTCYSDEYLDEVRKIMRSRTGKIGERE